MSIQSASSTTRPPEWVGRTIVIIVALLAGAGGYCFAGALGANDTICTVAALFVPVLVVEGGWAYRRKRGW